LQRLVAYSCWDLEYIWDLNFLVKGIGYL